MRRIRKGMWVKDGDRVGIVNAIKVRNLDPETEGDGLLEEAEFHLVNADDGTTDIVYHVPVVALVQADYNDIPECRRPTKSLGNALGYK